MTAANASRLFKRQLRYLIAVLALASHKRTLKARYHNNSRSWKWSQKNTIILVKISMEQKYQAIGKRRKFRSLLF